MAERGARTSTASVGQTATRGQFDSARQRGASDIKRHGLKRRRPPVLLRTQCRRPGTLGILFALPQLAQQTAMGKLRDTPSVANRTKVHERSHTGKGRQQPTIGFAYDRVYQKTNPASAVDRVRSRQFAAGARQGQYSSIARSGMSTFSFSATRRPCVGNFAGIFVCGVVTKIA